MTQYEQVGIVEKKNNVPIGSVIILIALALIVGFVAGTRKDEILNTLSPIIGKSVTDEIDFSSLNDIYKELKANYDGTLIKSDLLEGAKRGMVEAVGDDYTTYMNREEAIEFNKDLEGDIGSGIGVEIAIRNEVLTVIRPLKNNPAIEAGIKAGDVILKVNDESISEKTAEEASRLIRGESGTTVKLEVRRGEEILEFSIIRKEISNPSVELDINGGVAVLTISRFDQQTGSLAKSAAQEIVDKNIGKVILDLRGNGGGYVSAAKEVLSLWIDNQVVLSERSNTRTNEERSSKGKDILSGTSTIVLIDETSASASEIVAGALQDYKMAKLVGKTSYGKGSVQTVVSLDGGEMLKVTIAKWYTPNGQNITGNGITPDVEVELTLDDINNNDDKQLKEAIRMISN